MRGILTEAAGGRRPGRHRRRAAAARGDGTRPRASAAAPFQGHGSIGEAYALGATPGEHLTLVDGSGSNVGSGVVDSLGGIIIRNLSAGARLPVRGDRRQAPQDRVVRGAVDDVDAPTVVLLRAASPRRAQLRADARRDLHRRHRAPPSGQDPGRRPLPHRHRVLRVRHRRSPQPASTRSRARHRRATPCSPTRATIVGAVIAPAPGLRHRQRPDARDGVLGRRVRPLRAALGLRRLRHDPDGRSPTLGPEPQGGHGRHLLLGHLPVRGGRHRPARPGRHHPAQLHRRPLLHRLPGRDLQQRVRRELDRPAQGRRPGRTARAASRGRRPRSPPATPPASPTRSSTPRPSSSSRWWARA